MKKLAKLSVLGGCALIAVMLSPGTRAADDPPSTSPRESGVWQKHVYSFAFMGFTSTYSCDGLADKLKVLLIAAGARRDAKSQPGACASSIGRPDKFARADLTFYTLAPSGTPARSGTPAPSGSPPPSGVLAAPSGGAASDAKPVDAAWRTVVFADHSPRELSTGDCELIDQFRTNVLPMFTTRSLDNRTTCIPHQLSGSNISLRFDSLSLAPPPGGPAAPADKSSGS